MVLNKAVKSALVLTLAFSFMALGLFGNGLPKVRADAMIYVAPPCKFTTSNIDTVNTWKGHHPLSKDGIINGYINNQGYAVDMGVNGGNSTTFPPKSTTYPYNDLYPYGNKLSQNNSLPHMSCLNTDAIASISGVITRYNDSGGGGWTVRIDNSSGVSVKYLHLADDSTSPANGSTVTVGQRIATIGNTGNSFGTHLHFEVYKNNVKQSYFSNTDWTGRPDQWKFGASDYWLPAYNPNETHSVNFRSYYNTQYMQAANGGGGKVYANTTNTFEWETFKVVELNDGLDVAIKAYNGQYLAAEGGGGSDVNANRNSVGAWEKFRVINKGFSTLSTSGENGLTEAEAFKFIPVSGYELRADSQNLATWESFRFIPEENGKIYIQTFHGPYLQAVLGREQVAGISFNKAEWEWFEKIDLGNNKIALKGFNGKYLTAEDGGGREVLANRDQIGDWEKFEVITNANGTVSLKAFKGQYLAIKPGKVALKTNYQTYLQAYQGGGSSANANGAFPGEWETLTMEGTLDGFSTVKVSQNGYYLSAENGGAGGVIKFDVSQPTTSERFIIVPTTSPGKIILQTYSGDYVKVNRGEAAFKTANGYYLQAYLGGGNIVNAKGAQANEWESWDVFYK